MKKYGFLIIPLLIIFSIFSCAMASQEEPIVQKRQHISTFFTSFNDSSDNRKYNIKLATSNFMWIEVPSKQELSFNKTVGLRTQENGYKTAIVIQDGEYVEGAGGGVCQVSTTLYNAWLLAGLEVKAVKGHSVPASYIDKSLDATVSEYQDLILFNNTNMAVVVNGYVKDDKIYFDIYGPKGEYSYKLYSKVLSNLAPPNPTEKILKSFDSQTVIKDNDKEYVVLKKERMGYRSAAYLKVYKNKVFMYEKKIREDYYLPKAGIIGILETNN